jgi:hypothetical protein
MAKGHPGLAVLVATLVCCNLLLLLPRHSTRVCFTTQYLQQRSAYSSSNSSSYRTAAYCAATCVIFSMALLLVSLQYERLP